MTLSVISSMATRSVLTRMSAEFSKRTGITVTVESVGGVDAAKRIRAGETFDVVVLAANVMQQLEAEGMVRAQSARPIVQAGIAVAVAKGAAPPSIKNQSELRAAVNAARSIGYSTGPSGVYLEKLFAQWGDAEAIKLKTIQAPPGVPVGSLIADGSVHLGFQQLSELIRLEGITIIGPLPADVQLVTTFTAAMGAGSAHQADAASLISVWVGQDMNSIKQDEGMEKVGI